MGEDSGAAVRSEMLAAHGGASVYRAVEQYVLYSLDWLAAWAGHLFLCVLGEEPLRV